MADLNDPLKENYIGKVGDALTPYTAELTTKSFDSAARITELTGASKKIEDAGKLRVEAETALADAIKNEHTVRDTHYTLATPCAIRLPHIKWSTGMTSARCRNSRATKTSPPRRFTPTSCRSRGWA